MDSHQAIYDAVRSKISGCDSSDAIERAIRDQDWSHYINQAATTIADHATAPHVLMRPKVFIDGDQWSALYGENLQDGVAGFGKSPSDAMADFDKNWYAAI